VGTTQPSANAITTPKAKACWPTVEGQHDQHACKLTGDQRRSGIQPLKATSKEF
jgi:hypothetical protein